MSSGLDIPTLERWIVCIATVNFDLELGPVVDQVYPENALQRFTAAQKENIAFSAFPDSPSNGSEVHSFRIRTEPHQHPDIFIYGFAYFLQRRDAQSQRGYLQRSLVILSRHSYPSLLTYLVAKLGPLYFEHGNAMLETACHNIAHWQAPVPGSTLELGFIGSVVHVALPLGPDEPQFSENSAFGEKFDPQRHMIASIPLLLYSAPSATRLSLAGEFAAAGLPPPPGLISLCRPFLPSMWSIWEVLVLCEPLLVFAPTPAMTSSIIWWFRDLVRPLPYSGDFRPYFTIHDQDFPDFISHSRAKPRNSHVGSAGPTPAKTGLILGVTNPFFEGACSHWPHVLSLSNVPVGAQQISTPVGKSGPLPGKDRVPQSISKGQSFFGLSLNGSKGSSAVTRHVGSTGGRTAQPPEYVGPAPGWHTRTHSRYISKDRVLLKQLEDAARQGGEAEIEASWRLRQHFLSRSRALLVPLNRYLTSLIAAPPSPQAPGLASSPGGRHIDSTTSSVTDKSAESLTASLTESDLADALPALPTRRAAHTPPIRAFNTTHFLASLTMHGAALPFRSAAKQRAFYERWLRTPAFGAWLARAEDDIAVALERRAQAGS